MNITKFNAQVALADFKKALAQSEFCAFDEEMTGVDDPNRPLAWGQPPEAVYQSRRRASELFNAFQFGIALFVPHPDNTGTYDVLPYNFFLLNTEGDIRLDLKAIPFHNSNNMNFTLWLNSGLRYCTAAEEAALRHSLTAPPPTLTTQEDQQIFDRVVSEVKAWVAKSTRGATATGENEEDGNNAGEQEEATEALSLSEPCGYMVAKALKHYFDTQTELPVSFRYDGKPYFGENMVFTVEKLEEQKWRDARSARALDRERRLQSLLGFREYWKAIKESNKPMVGHNCFQDILFLIHMHEQTLPDNYQEFKQITHRSLPTLFDTKTLATKLTGEHAFAQTHLGYVYSEVRRRFGCTNAEGLRRVFRLPAGFYEYDEDVLKGCSKAHEAGYDAYMTGVCFHFLRQLHNAEIDRWKNVISAFGSAYFCTINSEKDDLVAPSTFIITSTVPCHLEQVEALLFTGEDREKVTVDGKIDVRKLSYRANGMDKNDDGLFTTFCVIFSTNETVASVTEKLKNASPSDTLKNVPSHLVPFLTVQQPQ